MNTALQSVLLRYALCYIDTFQSFKEFSMQLCLCLMQNAVVCADHLQRNESYPVNAFTIVLYTDVFNARLFMRPVTKRFSIICSLYLKAYILINKIFFLKSPFICKLYR
jgi:hypothetical protein